ncbi:peroxiredoxin [bacterium]|nr:peroxiredoxin [bacterium]
MADAHLPLLGEKFPSLSVDTTQGKLPLPDAFAGHWWVLFSHPRDFTPVCTSEFHSFAAHQAEFDALDTKLIGLSVDDVASHQSWADWIEKNLDMPIKFPIIGDDGTIAQTLGMVHPQKGNAAVRAVFVMDATGTIRTILWYPPELGRNISEVVRIVRALQLGDGHQVATPADWPQNQLIGDKVIVFPTPEQAAADGVPGAEKFAPWFNYKSVK